MNLLKWNLFLNYDWEVSYTISFHFFIRCLPNYVEDEYLPPYDRKKKGWKKIQTFSVCHQNVPNNLSSGGWNIDIKRRRCSVHENRENRLINSEWNCRNLPHELKVAIRDSLPRVTPSIWGCERYGKDR